MRALSILAVALLLAASWLDTAVRADNGGEEVRSLAPPDHEAARKELDKKNYVAYYDLCMELIRPGGLIAIDNALWSGRLVDETLDDPASTAIRTLNVKIRDDARVDMSLLPIGDGLMLARKLP